MTTTNYNAAAASAATNTNSTNTNTTDKTAADKNDPANKQMFLQLLVSQIKNQDPLNPTDGVQFLTQLAQFTQLENMVGMRTDIAAMRAMQEANQTPATDGTTTQTQS